MIPCPKPQRESVSEPGLKLKEFLARCSLLRLLEHTAEKLDCPNINRKQQG